MEFFLNWPKLSLSSVILVNSGKMINHWSLTCAQFKDLDSRMCLAGAVVQSWSLSQEVASSSHCDDKCFCYWIQWKHLGKTSTRWSNIPSSFRRKIQDPPLFLKFSTSGWTEKNFQILILICFKQPRYTLILFQPCNPWWPGDNNSRDMVRKVESSLPKKHSTASILSCYCQTTMFL